MKTSLFIISSLLLAGYLNAAELMPFQKFTISVDEKYIDQPLHFLVPEDHNKKSLPLIVLLHGGGGGTKPEHPLNYLKTDEEKWGGLLNRGEAVVVAPYMMKSEQPSIAWNNDGIVEEYLANVILEAHKRFNIDPERVILMGWSMGGYGAYHIAQSYPDRFAAVIAGAGGWRASDWRNSRTGGIPLILIHGEADAVYKKRPHYTDIQEALNGYDSMKKAGVNVHLLTTPGAGHSPSEQVKKVHEAWDLVKKRKRDLTRIFLSTPIVKIDKKDRGWISIDKLSPGKIMIEEQRQVTGKRGAWKDWDFSEEEFNAFKLQSFQKKIEGAWVDAVYAGKNRFDIKTKNIAGITVRMNDKMVNFAEPIVIFVNDHKVFDEKVIPDPKLAEAWFKKRKDLGMKYDGKVSLVVKGEG